MKFKPPTIEEAQAYAKSIGYKSFDYGVWYAFYETRGWHVGRTGVMRSWKGSIQTWYHRSDDYARQKQKPKPKPAPVVKKDFVPLTLEQKQKIRADSIGKKIEPAQMSEQEYDNEKKKQLRKLLKEK